jgi:hypothetical protein
MISLNLFAIKDKLTTKQGIEGTMDNKLIANRLLEKIIPRKDGSPNDMAFEGGLFEIDNNQLRGSPKRQTTRVSSLPLKAPFQRSRSVPIHAKNYTYSLEATLHEAQSYKETLMAHGSSKTCHLEKILCQTNGCSRKKLVVDGTTKKL